MQRHPHFAAAAMPGSGYPQALPAFPQFSSAVVTSPPIPVAAFALQAKIPSPVSLSPPRLRTETADQVLMPAAESEKKSKSSSSGAVSMELAQHQQQPAQGASTSKCSFSIESILSRGDDKSAKIKDFSARKAEQQQAAPTSSVSPATPLSAGPKPNGFYYFYPPPTAAQAFPFSPQSCLDSELHRSAAAALHGRLSAPVAVISEIVRNAAGT